MPSAPASIRCLHCSPLIAHLPRRRPWICWLQVITAALMMLSPLHWWLRWFDTDSTVVTMPVTDLA